MFILFLFVCSGATALVYEIIWSKYLSLLFGSTIQAQTVVLAVFMGGLAMGNELFGRRADRAPQPLRWYAALEALVGLYGLWFTRLYGGADWLFAWAGHGILERPEMLLALKGLIGITLLGPPTILMGGTLPILASWLQRQSRTTAGRLSARLYAGNTLGAVAGAALAGFVFLPRIGFAETMRDAAFINLGIAAIALAWSAKQSPVAPIPSRNSSVKKRSTPALAIVACSGAIALALEVLATRCLALIFGSSLQAFTTVLVAFILGIGLASAGAASGVFSRIARRTAPFLLVATAALLGTIVLNLENLVEFYRLLRSGLSATPVGYGYYQFLVTVVAVVVLGLPAGLLGAVLPIWIRVSGEERALGAEVGALLTWNTVGGVGGSLVAGFGLMPLLGLRGAFLALAIAALLVAATMNIVLRQRIGLGATIVIGVFVATITWRNDAGWRFALSSGVFRVHELNPSANPISARAKQTTLLFYEDAADATVSVEEDVGSRAPERVLRINGKADASSHGDLSTQILLGQLPFLMRPESTDVFCFGLGSGITAGTTLGHPLSSLTVAENCEPVRRAAQLFDAWNGGVLSDPRVKLYTEDARTVLKLGHRRYDAIIAEPSNPWMANIGSVFSVEFYRLAAASLKPGGIMTQWFHTYEMDDATVDLVLRTFNEVFPAMEIWDAGGGDIILLGSDQPWHCAPDVFATVFTRERPRRDLAAIGLPDAASVLARQLASQRTAFAIAGDGPLQTDGRPLLEYDAPRAMYIAGGRQAQQLQRFDERTYQLQIAPLEKSRVLAAMSDSSLKTVFYDAYPSVNPGLQRYVRSRIENNNSSDIGLLSMPCVFRPRSEIAVFEPAVARASVIVGQLCEAEAQVGQNPDHCIPAIETIREGLNAVRAYDPSRSGWSAAYFACLGSEAGLRLGLVDDAKAILLRGLQLDPTSEELNYLSRIFMREGLLTFSEYESSLHAGT
jgi:spermidine synthase